MVYVVLVHSLAVPTVFEQLRHRKRHCVVATTPIYVARRGYEFRRSMLLRFDCFGFGKWFNDVGENT